MRILCEHTTHCCEKASKSSRDLFRECLNATHDIFYYLISGAYTTLLDGKKQDMWILTGDKGLACLADAIYYDAAFPPATTRYGRVLYRDDYAYFRQCDRLTEVMGDKRRRRSSKEFDYEEIVRRSYEAIVRCEQQATMLLDKQ